MSIDPAAVSDMLHEGRHAEALALLQELFIEGEREDLPDRARFFMTMFQWRMLAEAYAPARAALAALREEQRAKLLAGDLYFGAGASALDDHRRRSRFPLVVQMNEILGDPRSTHALFVQLEAAQPALARSYAWQALPAMVEVGDFALADRYRGDPLALLDEVNALARCMPLFPPNGKAPRLAAELSNLASGVRLGMAVLRGLRQEAASDALGHALLDNLESDEVRALAQRELDEPGAIHREVAAHQMAREAT